MHGGYSRTLMTGLLALGLVAGVLAPGPAAFAETAPDETETSVTDPGAADPGLTDPEGADPSGIEPSDAVVVEDPEPLIAPGAVEERTGEPGGGASTDAAVRSSGDESKIYDLVNAARIKACVPILNRNTAIDTVARNWSVKLASGSPFAHNPNYTTQIPSGWIYAGENIAAGYGTGYYMFEAWMASSGHRANILNANYTDIGIGFVRGGSGYGTYGTQNFARYSARSTGVFLDVRPWTKFYTEINWMGTSGLSTGVKVQGCTSGVVYNSKTRVSREAVAAFLYRLKGSPSYTAPKTSPFADLKTTDPFYKEITWLASEGITTGVKQPSGKPKFLPKSGVTREAMAAFMYRYSGKPAYAAPTTSYFADVRPGVPFYKEISWMYKTGLSTGTKQPSGKPTYTPKNTMSREAMAAFVYRLDH